MGSRPRLREYARPLRREHGAVQFGLSADAGLVVEGIHGAELALLESLDGTRELGELRAAASVAGLDPRRVEQLLAGLRARGLLVERPSDTTELAPLAGGGGAAVRVLRERRAGEALALAYRAPGDGLTELAGRRGRRVLVCGEGVVPDALVAALRACGVGRVAVGAEATGEVLGRLADRARPGAPGAAGVPARLPHVVVLTAVDALPIGSDTPWTPHGLVHLPVVVQGPRLLVGPLIVPGRGPCLRCLELHRRDRDPSWPALLTQIACRRPDVVEPAVDTDPALATVGAGLAAMVVGTHLDGRPVPDGVSLEVALPWPRVTQRGWSAHPRCTCAGSGTAGSWSRGQGTMGA